MNNRRYNSNSKSNHNRIYNPSTWTNKDVVATAKATVGGYTILTSETTTTNSIKITPTDEASGII